MLLAILIVQTATLLAIGALAITGRLRGPEGPQGPPGPPGRKGDDIGAPPVGAVRRDLSQILILRGSAWVHHGWVETDSDAYHDARNRPGYAVSRDGEIDFGVQ